jgi:hypothetical protein
LHPLTGNIPVKGCKSASLSIKAILSILHIQIIKWVFNVLDVYMANILSLFVVTLLLFFSNTTAGPIRQVFGFREAETNNAPFIQNGKYYDWFGVSIGYNFIKANSFVFTFHLIPRHDLKKMPRISSRHLFLKY